MSKKINSGLFIAMLALALSFFAPGAFAGLFANALDTTTQVSPHEFSHFETGFPLTGAHATVDCGACHAGGVMKGAPRNCAGCHAKGMRIVATTMSSSHLVTNDPCEICHASTATFLGARFNHGNAMPGACTTCHNGRIALGKPASHNSGLRGADSCDKCHRTMTWTPAHFDHSGVVPGTCATQCHNGNLATGKPASHHTVLKSTSACDTCHRFTAWLPSFYNHASVVPGSCASNCHNGADATGKPAGHTGAKALIACDSCHNTAAWVPAGYNHLGVAPGTCLTCHAAQRPTSHLARGYVASCDACHSITSAWTFNHALQQGKHTCNSCHSKHHNDTPCDYCHSVNGWGG